MATTLLKLPDVREPLIMTNMVDITNSGITPVSCGVPVNHMLDTPHELFADKIIPLGIVMERREPKYDLKYDNVHTNWYVSESVISDDLFDSLYSRVSPERQKLHSRLTAKRTTPKSRRMYASKRKTKKLPNNI